MAPRVALARSGPDFEAAVWPLLESRCLECHNGQNRSGGIRIDDRDNLLQGGDSGIPAIVPGDPEGSLIIELVRGDDPTWVMPERGPRLDSEQVALLIDWIAEGALWSNTETVASTVEAPEHWAYRVPERPEPPEVDDPDWCRNPIDRFILCRLEKADLEPNSEADPAALIRRVTLDLTGLPPDPQTVHAFLNDPTPDRYGRLVDRLLDDPAYGERWARPWLDLARYADSQGYAQDQFRTIWRYRDWVIGALNANMPFDRFTVEQLAGDLLDEPTTDQLLATAFHRNTMTNSEGGTDDEEFRVAAVVDRVNTTGQVWLGTTVGCAQCHTHKYDPITQTDYYRLFAVFNTTADSDKPDERPTISTPTPWQAHRITQLEARIQAIPEASATCVESDNDADSGSETPMSPREVLQAELEALRASVPQTPILKEQSSDEARTTHMLIRGSFLDRGPEVAPGVPEALAPWRDDWPTDRRGLAVWILSEDNPLTARVVVNRAWEQIFGLGLVETSEDFGTQGEPPSHPELLDWLACEFRDGRWDLKALHRLLVTSATYRQSSQIRSEHRDVDARNRLLGRGPRHRLSAEMLRDQALAVSGLLVRTLHGPSVKPPQPPGLWKAAFDGRHTKYDPSLGSDRYRRGLYTIWRRTSPHPTLMTFDAPSREVCVVRRLRTNTPLQALVTLNDPVYVEAAQAFARRIVLETPTRPNRDIDRSTDERRIVEAVRIALAREPDSDELALLLGLLDDARVRYHNDPKAAEALATDPLGPIPDRIDVDHGELAAWTVLANVLLNLNEGLTRP